MEEVRACEVPAVVHLGVLGCWCVPLLKCCQVRVVLAVSYASLGLLGMLWQAKHAKQDVGSWQCMGR